MTITIGNYNLHFQLAPLYGLAAGYVFYAPTHEPDVEEIDEDEDYQRHQLMFIFFALIVTVWKS